MVWGLGKDRKAALAYAGNSLAIKSDDLQKQGLGMIYYARLDVPESVLAIADGAELYKYLVLDRLAPVRQLSLL